MRIRLATKISATIFGVLALALLSSVMGLYLAYGFNATTHAIVVDNLASVRAAEELEISLLEQRGYVSWYVLDGGNREWLSKLDQRKGAFVYWMSAARATAKTEREQRILHELEAVHQAYDMKRDEAVARFDSGDVDGAKEVLLRDVYGLYTQAYNLCEAFLEANNQYIATTGDSVSRQVRNMTLMIGVCAGLTIGLGVVLVWLFLYGVLFPLRRMAADAQLYTGDGSPPESPAPYDELRELGLYLQTLMADVTETRSSLKRSRDQLLQSEKLATVGKLAASVAHEIRNPLTSIKMWLYSLRRAAAEHSESRYKFDLVSEEVSRLEAIVANFLEFSRPPDLKLAPQNVASLLDKTLELMRHRLVADGVDLVRRDQPDLPAVVADADQLKQVFLNLIDNALDAMPAGGRLEIDTCLHNSAEQRTVAVRIKDRGAGMPEEVQRRIFEPFFSTKDAGTGLGLCIAASVVSRHNGRLVLESSSKEGTVFVVQIPVDSSP